MDARAKAWTAAAGPRDGDPKLVFWQMSDGTWAYRWEPSFPNESMGAAACEALLRDLQKRLPHPPPSNRSVFFKG